MNSKWTIRRLLVGLIGLIGLIIVCLLLTNQRSGSRTLATPPTLQQIQALAELVTLKIQVTDVQMTSIQGQTGGIKAVIMVHGEVAIGVDLSVARFTSVDNQHHTATLRLPQPKLLYARLDHERTKVVDLSSQGLWRIVPDSSDADAAVINIAYRDAQRELAKTAEDQNLIRRSRTQAERVLVGFFDAVGWRVAIRW